MTKLGSRLPLIISFILIFAVVAVYIFAFSNAKQAADDRDWLKAKRYILFPSLYTMLDENLSPYVEAGILFSKEDYPAAGETYKALGDYRDCEDMEILCRYNQAQFLMDEKKYDQAEELFKILSNEKYKDASAKVEEIEYLRVHDTIDSEDLGELLTVYETARQHAQLGNEAAAADAASLGERLYITLKKAYEDKGYPEVIRIAKSLGDYEDAQLYSTLSAAATDIEHYDELVSLIGTLDAADILINQKTYACRFLQGYWMSDSKRYWFSLAENGRCKYNIPSDYMKGAAGCIFSISNAEFTVSVLVDEENFILDTIYVFRFRIIDRDTIELYSFNNDTTYTMYRQ